MGLAVLAGAAATYALVRPAGEEESFTLDVREVEAPKPGEPGALVLTEDVLAALPPPVVQAFAHAHSEGNASFVVNAAERETLSEVLRGAAAEQGVEGTAVYAYGGKHFRMGGRVH